MTKDSSPLPGRAHARIAVLFPGVGYTCDKPLLYYAAKLARALGYEVLPVPYGHFPKGVKGDAEKMRLVFDSAFSQAEALLADVDWNACGEVAFIGKSIGTAVAARYAREKGLRVKSVLLTPLAETFACLDGDAIAFHGTADPWADTAEITRLCAAHGVPLHLTPGANHSLETGDIDADLDALARTMAAVRGFLGGREDRP